MTSVEFLKNELQNVADRFPTVHIKYGYNQIIEAHIVELLPLVEYNTNSELDKAWIPISLKFNETFRDEEVVFISSDSSLSLNTVIFEFNTFARSEEDIITGLFAPLTEEIINYSFPTVIPDGKLMIPSIVSFLNAPIQQFSNTHYEDSSYLAAA